LKAQEFKEMREIHASWRISLQAAATGCNWLQLAATFRTIEKITWAILA
jgi:hypothetical protein